MKQPKKKFDPDRLVLTKDEILDFCDRVLDKWSKDPTENAQNIITMNTRPLLFQTTSYIYKYKFFNS